MLKPLLFKLEPEEAHRFTVRQLHRIQHSPLAKLINRTWQFSDEGLERHCMGLRFKNPIGLAAGFDKDAAHIDDMAALGFGFVEVGTVTPRPQEGNPKPRLFRLPKDQALINRMGFNNGGIDAMVARLENRERNDVIIGGNIGKNKLTPNENAIHDYEICFEKLKPFVDYFVINVSSPNTPGLRELQDKEPLNRLLGTIQEMNHADPIPKPVLLKIAPDLNTHQLDDILEVVGTNKLQGIIATNTTLDRSTLSTQPSTLDSIGNGGLSGKPLLSRSTDFIRTIRKSMPRDFVIIGVGGVFSGDDAIEKIEAGADLVQVYTGLIYQGPTLIKEIKQSLKGYQHSR